MQKAYYQCCIFNKSILEDINLMQIIKYETVFIDFIINRNFSCKSAKYNTDESGLSIAHL